jgi:hypothetical protein
MTGRIHLIVSTTGIFGCEKHCEIQIAAPGTRSKTMGVIKGKDITQ